ncbi:MAG: S9 family peptidase [Candidatus Zixiibacteriota bacterium]|nr:MAG: S9 family peptidase [candidate division Zixibacteria bacterium]
MSLAVRAQQPTPPVAPIHPHSDTLFGVLRVDNYAWLRDRDNPEVLEYLKAENAYADAMMKHAESLREKLYKEIIGRIQETDLSVPVRHGDYFYYYREEKGKQYRIYCRKKGSLEAEEQILLDVNKLAEGKDFMRIGTYQISPDHNLLLFSTDDKGNERYTLHVKNLNTGEVYPDSIPNTTGDAVWANANKTIFYTIPDDAWRPYKLYRHLLGTPTDKDVMVFHEPDEMFWMGISRTKSDAYIIMDLGSNTTSEAWFLPADSPTAKLRIIAPRRHMIEYSVSHHGDDFYILTNDEATDFRVMKAPVSSPDRAHWTEVVPHHLGTKIDAIELFSDYMVRYQRENGLRTIVVDRFSTGENYHIDFPEPVYTYSRGDNPEYTGDNLRFTYMSLVSPDAVYDYNMATRERVLRKERKVKGGYDKSLYTSERLFAKATDGTPVPISLVYRKGLKKDGNNPLLLYGYGAYGASMDPWFSTSRLSLLDRGFVFAIAHIRGGGEMGRRWYENGKLMHKRNTFTDFIDCAKYLIEQKYTNPNKLVIQGGSAGGLLIGAVLNMRPDLFKVAIAQVPFVDIVNTMLDETIPLTAIEWEEWGDPHKEDFFRYMLSYSPYDNVKPQAYPAMLVRAGLNDTRVGYWEPAKWVAKLRATKTDDHLLLLKTNMGAGHGGASGRYDYLKDVAFNYAFILDQLGITE